MDLFKDIVEIAQGVVIIGATIFTARWTFKTFALKEKIKELREFRMLVDQYHYNYKIFVASLKDPEFGDKELNEKMALISLHNKIVGMSKTNLYLDKKVRDKILSLVGGWISEERTSNMIHRKGVIGDEEKRKDLWAEFQKEYEEVSKLFEDEAKSKWWW